MFSISSLPIDREKEVLALTNDKAGALVVFEGWVRDHNEGKKVKSLEYQIYHELALKEGEKILQEAKVKFNLHGISATHREGHLKLGDIAIWIGVVSSHRDDAFKAARFVIDEIKHRLPVWKKEHYVKGSPEWVYCKHHHHHVHFKEQDFYAKQAGLVDQNKLKKSHVTVIGAGGLGCPVLTNLALAGVGKITIIDPDTIDISNLHRQPLYTANLVGEKKAHVARVKIQELNSHIQVESHATLVGLDHVKGDLIIDCTDNLSTKYFLHDACHKLRIPLVSASVFKTEGVVRTFVPGNGCLRCIEKTTPDDSYLGNCNDFGVLGVTTSILGGIEASEAIEFLQHGKNSTTDKTLYLNFKTLEMMKVKNVKREDCEFCAGSFELPQDDLEVTSGMEILDIRDMSDDEVLERRPAGMALCCHKGVRSKRLALMLRDQGVKAYSLKGGACSL